MQNYLKTSHSVCDLKYHLVWTTNYRKPVLRSDMAEPVREFIRLECKRHDFEIVKGQVAKDHVHLLVSVPRKLSISKLMQHLKDRSSYKLLQEYKRMRKQF